MKLPILYIIIPCYNEEEVLSLTAPMFKEELSLLIDKEKIDKKSRILFVDDGSKDKTWDMICDLSKQDKCFCGISQSVNMGHQNAVLAGLMEAKDKCDITISIDCDGQDDIKAMELMVDEYLKGNEIVYGVRKERKSDTFIKRFTAQLFYKLLSAMGIKSVYNHADYRLVSKRALEAFSDFKEVNLFLRGMFPLVGFKSSNVYYNRTQRLAGKTHYPFKKMASLAINGITSLSVKPIRIVTATGTLLLTLGIIAIIAEMIKYMSGHLISGIALTMFIMFFLTGLQLLCLGIVGEYIGKIYMEIKKRPRYIISKRTENTSGEEKE